MLPFLKKGLYSLRADCKQLSKIATEVVLPSFSNPYYLLLSKTLFFVLCFCLWFSFAYFFQYFKDPPHTVIFYIYKVCLCAVNIRIYFLWCIKNEFFFSILIFRHTPDNLCFLSPLFCKIKTNLLFSSQHFCGMLPNVWAACQHFCKMEKYGWVGISTFLRNGNKRFGGVSTFLQDANKLCFLISTFLQNEKIRVFWRFNILAGCLPKVVFFSQSDINL